MRKYKNVPITFSTGRWEKILRGVVDDRQNLL